MQLPGNKYHVNCAASAPEPALRFRPDKIHNVLEKTGVHDLASTLPATERREMPRLFPHSVRSPFCLYIRIILAFCHCCERHLTGQQ